MNAIDIAKDYIPQREIMILQPKGHFPMRKAFGQALLKTYNLFRATMIPPPSR